MKPVIRYQSQLLFRRSYKPDRATRIKVVCVKFSKLDVMVATR